MILASVFLEAFAGCRFRPPVAKPPVKVPGEFSASGGEEVIDQWWKMLGDETLDLLVKRSLQGNLDIKIMWSRLDAAKAQARIAGAGLYPSVDGEAKVGVGFSEKKTSAAGVETGGATPSFLLGVAAGYEVDLWGRVRSTRKAAVRDFEATRESLKAAAISLSGEVAVAWFSLLEAYGQIRLLKAQEKLNNDFLKLVALRMGYGETGAVDLLQQKQLIESTRNTLTEAEVTARLVEHRLALLLGRGPDENVLPEGAGERNLPELPALPNAGVPSDLLKRRPDVRAAYQQVEAANERVAAAIADRFPKLSLAASVQVSDDGVKNLFNNWLVSLAANLLGPIFDGGRRKAEVSRTRAVAAEALHAYGKTILQALYEVEDALLKEQNFKQRLDTLREQLRLSEMVVQRARDNYVHGVDGYLRVLDAMDKHQTLQRNELTLNRRILENRVALCRALAGGWKLVRPEKKKDDGTSGAGDDG